MWREDEALRIHAWVILDNHFHAILSAPDLMQVMRDFKRHTARRILDQLRAENCDWLLNQFEYFHAAHKAQSESQVWQEGFHPVATADDEMMLQKMEYLHHNPWREDWYPRLSAGDIPPRTSGARASNRFCAAIPGGEAQLQKQVRSEVELRNEAKPDRTTPLRNRVPKCNLGTRNTERGECRRGLQPRAVGRVKAAGMCDARSVFANRTRKAASLRSHSEVENLAYFSGLARIATVSRSARRAVLSPAFRRCPSASSGPSPRQARGLELVETGACRNGGARKHDDFGNF